MLEKHADFLRDFRGDTIHPSTLELMHELGLLDEFLQLPHQKARDSARQFGDERVTIADFSPPADALQLHRADAAMGLPRFPRRARQALSGASDLLMRAEATGLIEEGGRVVGVRATTPDGQLEIRADLVVGADGRHSTVRERAGLAVDGARRADGRAVVSPAATSRPTRPRPLGRFDAGSILVMLDRGDYWQCAYRDSQGRLEARQGAGHRGVPRARSRGSRRSSPTASTSLRAGTTSSC